MGARSLLAIVLVLLVAAPAHAAGRTRVPTLPGRKPVSCGGQPFVLFDNTNTQDTTGGGGKPSFDTNGRTYCLISVSTSHEGAAPGQIGVRNGKASLGPWPATGDTETWDAAPPGPLLIHGRYSCTDSDPPSWSQNTGSAGNGFCVVRVVKPGSAQVPQPAKLQYTCVGTSLTLFDNSNTLGVSNGGKRPLFTTYVNQGIQAYCLNSIRTYHYNGGHGAKPGKLGLGPANLSALFNKVPVRRATGSSGQNNAPDVNWQVDFNASPPTIISGAYFCNDSSQATWSSNNVSKGDGFCTITATPAFVTNLTLPGGAKLSIPPPPTPQPPSAPKPKGQVRCFTGTLSTMLLYPHTVATGSQGMVLLQCGVKKADGFQGRLAPSAVFAITTACAGFWTYPSPFGTPPPPAIVTYNGPQNSGCSKDMHFLPFTVHGPWRIDIQAYDRVAQAPLNPATYAVYVRYPGGDPQAQNTWVVQ